jgi:hypothetical protein
MKTPFGNSGAALKLAELVENDINSRRYVSSTLSELGLTVFGLFQIQNPKIRRHLCDVVKRDYLVNINSSAIPDKTKSYLKNVVLTKCRSVKRCFDTKSHKL